jgi:septal ring factor EnvC (AmiA/AmiB activator)
MSAMFAPDYDSKKDAAMEETRQEMDPQKKFRILGALLAAILLVAAAEGFYSWSLNKRIQQLEAGIQTQINSQDENIQDLQDQLGMHEKNFANLQGQLATTKTNLTSTVGELRSARRMADELAKQQRESSDQFTNRLGELQQDQESTKSSVGSLSSDVNGVKQDVTATKQDLASTRSELQRTIGDLGVQSGLIATNRKELDELKLRGERIYVEFDLSKTKQPQKYAGANVALQLKKTDVKRQKYTMNLISDDRVVEKKDKNTNEPVQFYQQGYRIPCEIVVNEILKDRIVGYISVPKTRAATTQMSGTATPASSQSGS